MKSDEAFEIVKKEFLFAFSQKLPFNSPHEGAAVIEEEWDELWDEVKKSKSHVEHPAMSAIIEETKQTAAMLIRFLVDLC